jgi:hypothetical protein
MDSVPSYTREMTPRADSDLHYLATYMGEVSPTSNKFGDLERPDKKITEPSPKAAQYEHEFSPTQKVKASQVAAPASTPIVMPTPMTSSLRKRKPIVQQKIEPSVPTLRSSAAARTNRVPERRDKQAEHEDDESDNLEIAEAELPPERQAMLFLLVKILKHDAIIESDIEGLSPVDLEIVRSIVKRKYGVSINPRDFDDKKKLILELNSLDSRQTGAKRSEENNKLVFKRAIKCLLSTYKATHKQEFKDFRKKEYESVIVREFFGGIPLPEPKKKGGAANSAEPEEQSKAGGRTKSSPQRTSIVSPITKGDEKIRRFVINPNTINAKYIRFVFKSTAFKEFFDDFVANHFIADYRKNRPNKVRKIIDAVYVNFHSKKTRPTQLQNAKDYIEKNPKFKMPWSDKELETCIKSTKEFIQRVFRVRDEKRKRR